MCNLPCFRGLVQKGRVETPLARMVSAVSRIPKNHIPPIPFIQTVSASFGKMNRIASIFTTAWKREREKNIFAPSDLHTRRTYRLLVPFSSSPIVFHSAIVMHLYTPLYVYVACVFHFDILVKILALSTSRCSIIHDNNVRELIISAVKSK